MLDVRRPAAASLPRILPRLPGPSPATGDPAARLLGAAPTADPGPYLRELRLAGPAVRCRSGWATACFDVASAALAHEDLAVDAVGSPDGGPGGGLPPAVSAGPTPAEVPWAAPLRAALAGPAVAGLGVDVGGWVDGLVEELPTGRVDLVEAFVAPLAGMVAGELVGLPSADWPALHSWVEDLVPEAGTRPETVGAGHRVRRHLHDHLVARRAVPGDAVLDDVLREGTGGEGLTRHEAGAAALALLLGGYVTTHAVVGAALVTVVSRPEQVEVLLARPGLWRAAVDEAMRADPPVPVVALRAPTGTSVAGFEVAAGERLVVSVAGANRDPDAFPEPDTVDVGRGPSPAPIGPERTGVDRASAGLARSVAEIALSHLMTRHPNIRLVDPPERMWRAGLRDVRRLDVRPGQPA